MNLDIDVECINQNWAEDSNIKQYRNTWLGWCWDGLAIITLHSVVIDGRTRVMRILQITKTSIDNYSLKTIIKKISIYSFYTPSTLKWRVLKLCNMVRNRENDYIIYHK